MLAGSERQHWVNPQLADCLIKFSHDKRFAGIGIGFLHGAHGPAYARNMAITKAKETNVDWLVQIDNDQSCPQLLDILCEADAARLDIVSVACGAEISGSVRLNVQLDPSGERNGNFLRIVQGGSGVLLLRRSVWERIPAPLFVWDDNLGEDVRFCQVASASGFKLWTHTSLAAHFHSVDLTSLVRK